MSKTVNQEMSSTSATFKELYIKSENKFKLLHPFYHGFKTRFDTTQYRWNFL